MGKIIFITGTDTGVGKTVLTGLLLQHLRRRKIRALAMKPFCTGDRGDVRFLQALQAGEISDSEMNPFYFREPVAPFIAARNRKSKIHLEEAVRKIFDLEKRCDVLLVEGAGGVMVPLGDNFFMRDLIAKLKCHIVLVARNGLGTINHTLLTAASLKDSGAEGLAIVLMGQVKPDASVQFNQVFIQDFVRPAKVFTLPFLNRVSSGSKNLAANEKKIKKTLAMIIGTD